MKSEELIQKQNRTSRSTEHGKLMFPVMEKELYKRFIYTRRQGKRIKRWWFNTQAKQVMIETYPEHVETFKISARWFAGFCRRNNISLRRETHASQKTPQQLRKLISELHAKTMTERRWGRNTSRDLTNIDQTPLTFVLDDNKTCDKKEAEEVWITRDQSGLEKHQCTIQLTMFADGKRLPPIIIFRGQVLRINAAEKKNSIDALKLFFSLKLGVTRIL